MMFRSAVSRKSKSILRQWSSSTASSSTATADPPIANFSVYGRLWGRGYEDLMDRQIIHIKGLGATKYLQNLITSNLMSDVPPTAPRPEVADESNLATTTTSNTGTTTTTPPTEQPPLPEVKFNPNLRSTCFLDPKGRIITDALLWKINENEYYIDAPYHDYHANTTTAESVLLQHLHQYKLRRTEVTIEHYNCHDTENNTCRSHVLFGTLESGMDACPPGYVSGLDPRHPSLGVRILQLPEAMHNGLPSLKELVPKQFSNMSSTSNNRSDDTGTSDSSSSSNNSNGVDHPNENTMQGNYNLLRRLAGIAEGSELTGRIALESNQELLNAISFDKGCYLGQELTARVFHTGVIRKRIMPLILLEAQSVIPQPWIIASQLQEQRLAKHFSISELQALPSRLPRLSVAAAGQLVAITTASIEPSLPSIDADAADELQEAQVKATKWLQEEVEVACQLTNGTEGAKIIDSETGTTVGQIVAPPVKGTNLILALMRLESVGLINGGTWSKTNKVTINGKQFRYLPYLPLWWPELSLSTGKEKRDDEDYSDEARNDSDPVVPTNSTSNSSTGSTIPPGMTRIEIEEIPGDNVKKG